MDETLTFATLREVETAKIFNTLSNFTVKDEDKKPTGKQSRF